MACLLCTTRAQFCIPGSQDSSFHLSQLLASSTSSHLFSKIAFFLPVRILANISRGMGTFSKPTGWKWGMKGACARLDRARVCTRLMASLKTRRRILESHLRSLNLLCHSVSELAKLIRLPKGVNNCVRVTAKVRQLGRNHGIRVQTIPPCTTRRTAVYLKYNNMRMLIVDCQGLAETIVLIKK